MIKPFKQQAKRGAFLLALSASSLATSAWANDTMPARTHVDNMAFPPTILTNDESINEGVNVPSQSAHHALMAEPHNMTQSSLPLADALISIYFPVINEVIELESPPLMLDAQIQIEQGGSRQEAIASIAKQLNATIELNGNVVKVNGIERVSSPNIASITIEDDARATAPMVSSVWSLNKEEMLSDALERFTKRNGIKLLWDAKVDYKIAEPFTINEGSPMKTIRFVLGLYDEASKPLQHIWYEKQGLLLVQDKPNY